MRISNLVLVGVVFAAACSHLPGVPKIPDNDPLNPSSCGGYSSSDAGRKLHAFLQATQDLEKATAETADVVKQSCITLGTELGIAEADMKGEGKDICAKVYGVLDNNLKDGVVWKSRAALKIKITPAVCQVNVTASVEAAATCEAKGSADIGAKCSGSCTGECKGTCSAKGADGKCAGSCDGQCSGSCDGYADVKAEAQCKAAAEVKGSAEVTCTEPSVEIESDAKLTVDAKKAEQTIKAMKAAFPKIFSIKARLVPMQHAVETWVKSAAELKSSAISLYRNFKDQGKCVAGQVYAAAKLTAGIQSNVSFSVNVTVSASASAGTK
jgi:hypothetical protein